MFTVHQYDEAIQALQDAKKQLEPDGNHCSICGDCGHQAWECRFNPLKAMAVCTAIAKQSDELHTTLHWLAGYDFHMGQQRGPANTVVPAPEPKENNQ